MHANSSAHDTLTTEADRDWPAPPSRLAEAWRDLVTGVRKNWMWRALAMQDIRLRYRGSMIGPFWLTISTIIMVGTIGVLYSVLFRMHVSAYLPFLAVGYIVWQLISSLINEGCVTFVNVSNIVQQVPLPFSIHVYRVVFRNLIVFAHNIVIIPVVLAIFAIPVGWGALMALPGLAVVALNGAWMALFFGLISARFRDIPPIVANFTQVVFFVTPIFWPAESLGEWRKVAEFNPIFSLIDVVRAPLLGVAPTPHSWPLAVATTVAGCAVTFLLFARFRSRIAYWL